MHGHMRKKRSKNVILMLTVCPCSSHSLLPCNLHRKSGHSQSLRLGDTAISAFDMPPFPLQILPRKSIKSFFLAFVVLVDISRSHPVHTSFLFIRFSMRFGRFSERFLLCERGARSSYSNHFAAEPPAEQHGAAQRR